MTVFSCCAGVSPAFGRGNERPARRRQYTVIILIAATLIPYSIYAAPAWRVIQPGVEYAEITADSGPLHVVRVDPQRARVRAALASEKNVPPQTAHDWCRTSRFAVAINLGMFQSDQRSNVGYLRNGTHRNNARWNSYRSVLAVNPSEQSLPSALWIDLDQKKRDAVLDKYGIVVQNLRLIAGNRKNVWSKSDRRWSEAALAIDTRERLLFIFSRAPHSMRDFNTLLLRLPLDITRAMHLEGGPEASLSIHAPGIDLDLSGSFETGFWPNDSNQQQWPIPNVLGVLRDDAASP